MTPLDVEQRRSVTMSAAIPQERGFSASTVSPDESDAWRGRLSEHFAAQDQVRRGLCLLNAGQFEAAEETFRRALQGSPRPSSTAAQVIAAYYSRQESTRAEAVAREAVQRDPNDMDLRVRQAWLLHEDGRHREGVEVLREGLALSPGDAELQLQLGMMLAAAEEYEEAEMRFAQATAIRKEDSEGWVHLALCQGVMGRYADAIKNLQRAQRLRPQDPHIALLLTQAFRAARDSGTRTKLSANLPPADDAASPEEIEELSRILEKDTEFIDALLSVQTDGQDRRFHSLLLKTLHKALERRPQQAELHYHCGRVLERMGQLESAIAEGERAVTLDPRCTRALIDLARWYRRTRRTRDAAAKLEQVISAGFEYADVYCQLGELYHEQGQIEKAGSAYRRALTINAEYSAAKDGLEGLSRAPAVAPRS